MNINITAYIKHHFSSIIKSLSTIFKTPAASLMTILVLGIAIALPTGFYLLIDNTLTLGKNLDAGTQISVYLKPELTEQQVIKFKETISKLPDVGKIEYVSAKESYAEFKQNFGFDDALDFIEENPFPAILSIYPKQKSLNKAKSQSLLDFIKAQDEVDIAKLDLEWVNRLFYILNFFKKLALVLSILLGTGVLLIIANTLRLNIKNEQKTISITKLLGATDSFVRRPFLYTGSVYGLFGSIAAILITTAGVYYLRPPIQHLSSLYNSTFSLSALSIKQIFTILFLGGLLGYLGAYLTVNRYIKKVEN